jgi:3-keto-disaccharide hydrolase
MRLLLIILVLSVACFQQSLAQTAGKLRAGAYAADITPLQWPVRIIGGFVQPLATQARDPLHARAIVLDNGSQKVALVVVDSCYLPRDLLDRAKNRAERITGIPASNMLMSATHTHSAPPSKPGDMNSAPPTKPQETSKEESAYQQLLELEIAQAVVEAYRRLEPAQLAWGVEQIPDELNNRRWFMKPGTIDRNPLGGTSDQVKMNPPRGSENLIKPAGTTDPGFTVVAIRSQAGKPLALLANYSLHYVGGIGGPILSADYFGEFANQIAARLKAEGAGDGFVGILSNGTSGDVNNIDFRKQDPPLPPFEKIKIVAGKLADSALAIYKSASFRDSLPLAIEEAELPLLYRKPTPEQLAFAETALAEPDEKKFPTNAKAYALRARLLDKGPKYADVKLQGLRIGDLGIAAIPFEVFTEIGLEIKAKSPFKTTLTIELANGHYGYLPTPEQHLLGGYETWLGTNNVETEASRKITASILSLFNRLAANTPPPEEPVTPTSTIHLFDGKSLAAFDKWQVDYHHADPDLVFTVVDQVDGAPAIRISGQHYGGLITRKGYQNYKLVAEYRWGSTTWAPRSDRARDAGILLHCQDTPGNYQKDFNGPWQRSIEFQIIEGGVGDILVLGGYTPQGELLRPTLTAKTRKDRDGETVYDPNGQPNLYSSGRINWQSRSEDWADKLGFRGPHDPDSPSQEWTRIEAIVKGDRLTYYVNGKLVNEGTASLLTSGKILVQSEGAEIFFRKIDLEPLP